METTLYYNALYKSTPERDKWGIPLDGLQKRLKKYAAYSPDKIKNMHHPKCPSYLNPPHTRQNFWGHSQTCDQTHTLGKRSTGRPTRVEYIKLG